LFGQIAISLHHSSFKVYCYLIPHIYYHLFSSGIELEPTTLVFVEFDHLMARIVASLSKASGRARSAQYLSA
jgi:hypothetical protein